jgi:protoporphyrin/coproporphyrin ferrochelatase
MTDQDRASPPATPEDAVLLVNLGTPDAPTPAAVRRYLAEFLSDRRVIDTPRWIWWPLLYGVILRLRPRRSAHAYASIWTPRGSPLRVFSEALAARIDAGVRDGTAGRARAALAMCYGQPSVAATLERLRGQGMRRLLVLPLYPQYSATSTAAVFDAVTSALQRWRWTPELHFVGDYHDDAAYIAALAQSVEDFRRRHGTADKLLLSFHGIPERYVRSGDPYLDQCRVTAQRLRERLGLAGADVIVSFQSRVGREPWLQPYTDRTLRELPGRGVRHVQVLCPGFAVDCLETLEEIAIAGRDLFLAAGGERFEYIPALNDGAGQVEALLELIRRHAGGWFGAGINADAAAATVPSP